MIRLRRWSALIVGLTVASALVAQEKPAAPEKPASPWAVDRTLVVTPQPAPTPALKYRLLPLTWALKEGNAVPIYLRLVHEQDDAARKYWSETPLRWNELPVDKIPLEEARQFLGKMRYSLQQLELGARRRTAEWNYTLDAGDPIGLLLPDVQWMRSYAPMLVLQARVALAEGDFARAAHHLQTGFAFSRHMTEGPTLINGLVGIAIARQFAGAVGDFVERPQAPNLYWAIAALPHPLIDLRKEMDWEYGMLEMVFPELGDLDRERTAEQWDGVLRRVRAESRRMAESDTESGRSKLPDWFPKGTAAEDPAAKSPDLDVARRYVANSKGLPAARVEAMPPAQVLVLYIVGTYHETRDDWYRASYLPFPQAREYSITANQRLHDAPITEGHVPGRLLLPALDRVMARQIQLERTMAALQVVEALRMYVAAHDGKLPKALDEIGEVPVPLDPGTGKAFEYRSEEGTATIVGPNNEPQPKGRSATNGVRYRVSIRKK